MRIDYNAGTALVNHARTFANPEARKICKQIIEALNAGEISTCIFDFAGTDLIDSSGIGSLVSLAKEFKFRNAQLIIRNLRDDIFQLFEDSGLDRIFSIEKDGVVKNADSNIFETSGVDIRLEIKKESVGDIGIFIMSGVVHHPLGSSFFKQQLLLFLAEQKKILIDIEDLTFFDSLSISAILNMNNLLKNTGGSMRICSPNYIIRDLFTTLNIQQVIPVFDTREEALADWGINGK